MKKTSKYRFNTYGKLFLVSFILLNHCLSFSQKDYAQYVNPFIGTGGHGHTFPGAVLPFGMVQLSPDTRVDGSWDGCSGYHYSDKVIYGFSHTHLSGTGCTDWGDILLMPTLGKATLDNKMYSSSFSHKNEKAGAGFYEVLLDKHKIKAELTVTPRVGIHRYTFPKANEGSIVLDLLHRDKTLFCDVKVVDSVTICGYRVSEAWAKEQHVYFAVRFSKPFKKIEYVSAGIFNTQHHLLKGRVEGAYITFDVSDNKPLIAKMALSPVSFLGAIKNLDAEAKSFDFENYRKEAVAIWNKQLQKIEVEDIDKNKLSTFYTALYHCCIHPSLNMDVDNQYRGRDNKIHTANGFTNYSVYSLWDTYRALHPLFAIIERTRTSDFINSFLNQYNQSGRLPMWELSGNETDCMIGFHSVSVIADAMTKGIGGFDMDLAFQAAKAASNYTAYGIPLFNKKGFLEIDDESESVSKSLEYAYDNWCIAQMAVLVNKPAEAQLYLKRSQAYKQLFDSSTACMRPRKNGNWLTPFYPSEINNHFTEGNSWQYSFYVPHDVEGLIELHGGKENFEKKLDELFNTTEKTRGREQADVTGLIGQYAHGNEPSHHMAYLYNFVGKPQKTIDKVHQICKNFYKNSPDGLIGNEDCGQMSAWYVFSAMGFYPVCPGSSDYVLGAPIFKTIKINLEDGKNFLITSNLTNSLLPLQEVLLNNQKNNNTTVNFMRVLNGGSMSFIHAASKNDNTYGKSSSSFPRSGLFNTAIIPAPIVKSASQVFKEKLEVSIFKINTNEGSCYYTLDGTEPTKKSMVYNKPFLIESNAIVKAKVYTDSDSSVLTEARFYKLKYNYDVKILSTPNAQYAAEGTQSLIDGIHGDTDWRKGNWLGYQSQDFVCDIDLKEKKEISYISLGCLQDTRSWIVFPSRVNFYSSDDNKTFNLIDGVDSPIAANDYDVRANKFEKSFSKKINTRYIKIIATNYGKLPEWHIGKGGDAFIFVDECEIK